MYKIIATICLAFLLSFHSFAQSDEDSTQNAPDEYSQLEDVMFNTMHQFVYAFFGREMLLYYLDDDNDISVVEAASESDLVNLAAPFNSVVGRFFLGGLTVIYLVTAGYFFLRLFLFASEHVWILKKDGETYLGNGELKVMLIKGVLLGALVLIPIKLPSSIPNESFYTSPAIAFLFDMLGYAHDVGDEGMAELIVNQKQSLASVSLPSLDAKWDDGLEINRFFTCARMQETRTNEASFKQTVNFHNSKEGLVTGALQVGECTLQIAIGLDTASDKKVARINSADPSLGLDDTLFERAQKGVFAKAISNALSRGEENSLVLSKLHMANALVGENFTLASKTSNVMNVMELDLWDTRCDEDFAWTPSYTGGISRADRYTYNLLTGRCISKELTETLLYPDTNSAMSSFVSNTASSKKTLALCVDQATMAQTLGKSRFLSRYELGSATSESKNIEQISLNSCLSTMCSAQNLDSGGLYACANGLDIYENRLRDVQIKDRGTLMMGFYVFNLFVHQPPGSLAKDVYNRLSFEFFDDAEPVILTQEEPFFSVDVDIPPVATNAQQYSSVMFDLNMPRGDTSPYPTVNVPESGSDIEQIIGYSRLATCAKNPLQIANGYVCNNLPQEFSRFGFDLLKTAITLRTILVLGNTASSVKKLAMRRKAEGGTVTNQESKNLSTHLISASRAVFGSTDLVSSLFDDFLSIGFSTTDEFGYLDSPKINYLVNIPVVAGVIAIAAQSPDSMSVTALDTMLLIMLLFGVFFAIILPLIPMLMVISAITKFMYLLCKTILLTGFKLVNAIFDDDDSLLNEKMDELWADWQSTCLKLPLTVIGVVLAWLMSNVIIAHVLNSMDLSVPTNDGTQGIVDLVVMLLVSLMVVGIIYNMILTVIESFYDFTVEWVLGQMTNSPFSDKKAMGWKDSKDILHMIGR